MISVNRIFELLNQNWGNNNGLKWLEDNGIQKQDYRNGELNGNACKKLLQKLQKLKSQTPRRLHKYVNALKAFEKVRTSCFGQILHPDYKLNIELFHQAYKDLGVPLINKAHILVAHVPQFCELHQRGLGYFSEQARYLCL